MKHTMSGCFSKSNMRFRPLHLDHVPPTNLPPPPHKILQPMESKEGENASTQTPCPPKLTPTFPPGDAYRLLKEALIVHRHHRHDSEDDDDLIFRKYFPPASKPAVALVYATILGPDEHSGNDAMANMALAQGGGGGEGGPAARLAGAGGDRPVLYLDGAAAWALPDIGYARGRCAEWDRAGLTDDMFFLGSLLVEQYV